MSTGYFDLRGRVAVVIGGTAGLGRAIARGLAQAGADVAPTGRRAAQVEEAAAVIEALGRRSLRQPVDATNRASLHQLRDAVLEYFGRVDILVNSTGRTIKKPTVQVTDDEWAGIADAVLHATV